MKRDKQLIRALLLEIESREYGHCFEPAPLAEHDLESVKYHLHLLHQAGLVECELEHSWDGEPVLIARSLTLPGHDLLDNLRAAAQAEVPAERQLPLLTQLADAARESLRRIA
ncbi:DUF2513 domain-containing protein [Pseudomonas sp. Gutcm_11s]|uniref:DUF2513 domain-containing protein n=1 Tax=Pseudomonas sp. Gutcm_11s TaxID=3026088 RepID=UPI0023615BAD|nr:DUF2513 domain-containing protein [Pseudomonas sp. Gutcm_11s]MDD0843541.1 DUF2513 domain-containing protein [Pseudomonas sp. Gutcm_11s]